MSMSKKNYERFARIFAEAEDYTEAVDLCIKYFLEDNPRFDPIRFNDRIQQLKKEWGKSL